MDKIISLGTMYDFNQQLSSRETPLNDMQLAAKEKKLGEWFKTTDSYTALIGWDNHYITLFHFGGANVQAIVKQLIDILKMRGQIVSIDEDTINSKAWEIWLREPDSTGSNFTDYMYKLFPYNLGVVEVD